MTSTAADTKMAHPTPRVYQGVFVLLLGLLVLTVSAAFLPLDWIFGSARAEVWARRVTLSIAMTIAIVKGLLIVLFHATVGQVVADVLGSLLGLLVLLTVRCYLLLPTLHASSLAEPQPAVG